MTEFNFRCCSSRLTIEWQAQWQDQSFSCHCSRLTSDSDLLHLIALVSFMSLKQAHYWTCRSSRLAIKWLTQSKDQYWTCLWSRLTVDSCFSSKLAIKWLTQRQGQFLSVIVADSLLISVCNALQSLFCSLIVSMTRSISDTFLKQSLFWSRLLYSIALSVSVYHIQ